MEMINGERKVCDITRPISGLNGLKIGKTKGTKTIALAGDVFRGGINKHFQDERFNSLGEAREEMIVEVRELVGKGTFSEIFNSISTKTDCLYLTQEQIIWFVDHHRSWLLGDICATLFLFKGKQDFLVALVYSSLHEKEKLAINFDRLSFPHKELKPVGYRIVVPKMINLANKTLMVDTAPMPSYRP